MTAFWCPDDASAAGRTTQPWREHVFKKSCVPIAFFLPWALGDFLQRTRNSHGGPESPTRNLNYKQAVTGQSWRLTLQGRKGSSRRTLHAGPVAMDSGGRRWVEGGKMEKKWGQL